MSKPSNDNVDNISTDNILRDWYNEQGFAQDFDALSEEQKKSLSSNTSFSIYEFKKSIERFFSPVVSHFEGGA